MGRAEMQAGSLGRRAAIQAYPLLADSTILAEVPRQKLAIPWNPPPFLR